MLSPAAPMGLECITFTAPSGAVLTSPVSVPFSGDIARPSLAPLLSLGIHRRANRVLRLNISGTSGQQRGL